MSRRSIVRGRPHTGRMVNACSVRLTRCGRLSPIRPNRAGGVQTSSRMPAITGAPLAKTIEGGTRLQAMIKPYSNLLVSNCWTTLSPLYNLQNDRMVEANSKPVGSRRVSDFGFRGAGANGSVIGRFVGGGDNHERHSPSPPAALWHHRGCIGFLDRRTVAADPDGIGHLVLMVAR